MVPSADKPCPQLQPSLVSVKSKVEISQNFVAFSEYMNFKVKMPFENKPASANKIGFNYLDLFLFMAEGFSINKIP